MVAIEVMAEISLESSPNRGCQGSTEGSSKDWRTVATVWDFPNDESKEWVCLGSYAPILLGNWETIGYQPWSGTVISLAKLGVLTVCCIL